MKGLRGIIILLIVVVAMWIGFGVLFATSSDINPNAESYTEPLKQAFDTDGFDDLMNRISEALPVAPETFLVTETEN